MAGFLQRLARAYGSVAGRISIQTSNSYPSCIVSSNSHSTSILQVYLDPARAMNKAKADAGPSKQVNERPKDDLLKRIDGSRRQAASILQGTEWPRQATTLAQELLQVISKSPRLENLPKDTNKIPTEQISVMERLASIMDDVCNKLKKTSQKYGEKRDFSDMLKNPFASLNKDGCKKLLQECGNDMQKALASLPADLSNDSHSAGTPNPKPEPTAGAPGTTILPVSQDKHPNIPQPTPVLPSVEKPPSQPEKKSNFRRDALVVARKTFNTVNAFSGMIPVVGSYVGGAASVGLAVVELIQNMDSNEEATEDLAAHASKMSDLLGHFKKRSFDHQQEETATYINALQRELESVRDQVKELDSQSTFRKVFSASDRAESLQDLQDTIKAALEEMQLLVGLNTMDLITDLYNADVRRENRRLLDRLGDASYGARGDAVEDIICLPGTRVHIIKRIDNWVRSPSDSERVLWIRGMAGRGKSAIASTVAYQWRYRAICAVFHFRRGQNQFDKRLVCALARQLGSSVVSEVKDAVLQSIKENEDIAQERLQDQFNALLVGSLERLQNTSLPILFVVDALDECDDIDYAVNFVKLIDRHSSSLPSNVKFILTSRPEGPLLRALEPKKWKTENLDSLTDVDEDLSRFVQHSLSQIKEDHSLPEDWPSQEDVANLVRMSQGLFQWARTALKYIGDRSPVDTLNELLGSPSICDGLDDLYLQILSKAFEKVKSNSRTRDLFLHVLGTLLAAPYPVSLEVVGFLHLDQEVFKGKTQDQAATYIHNNILSDLNSLLLIPPRTTDPIRLMHTSIRDLLVDQERCRDKPYFVDLAVNHYRLTTVSFRLMGRDLKENICKLSDLSKANTDIQDVTERSVPKGLQYCCRSWFTHLVGSTLDSDRAKSLLLDLKRFSEEKLLCWLEVMSLIGAVREAIIMAKDTHRKLQQSHGEISDLSLVILWNDVHRFVTAFHDPISFGALHIYASALPFCPSKTKLWELYGSQATNRVLHGPQTLNLTWPLDVWSRSIGSDAFAIAFLPNGKVLLSGSRQNAIQFWSAETGAPLGAPIRGHTGSIHSIAISAYGKVFASGSSDKTIRLWDAETGQQVGSPLVGHQGAVYSVAWSPNGRIVASGSHDSTVRLWEGCSGTPIGEPLRGHSGLVRSVAISPNGSILASGSSDKTIRLWDTGTGTSAGGPLVGHDDGVRCISFSPNGEILASGSDDNTIRFWKAVDGSLVGVPLTGHTDAVISIVYSPDGKSLASGSFDDTIRLWSVETGEPIGKPLRGHTMLVWSVAFSPDGSLLASGGGEGTIRLWNTETDLESSEPLSWQSDSTLSIAFSQDHKILAYAYDQGTIQLWNVETGTARAPPLTGHSETVQALAFSPDGKFLVSGSHDSTIRLWDSGTGEPIGGPLTGHTKSVLAVAFSPDSNILASGSHDTTVRLWDVKKREPIGEPLKGPESSVWSIGFSADGKTLASGNSRGAVLWDTTTWGLTGKLREDHSNWFHYSASSTDQTQAIQYVHGDLPSWDPQTCPQCNPLLSPESQVLKVINERIKAVPLTFEGQWITFLANRLFWLPSSYWNDKHPKIVLSQGKLVFINQGVLSIFDVSRALKL